MATREENLKKINEELEKLNDEELENVAGGQIIRMSTEQEKELIKKDSPKKYDGLISID